tara:strand:- start:1946 stop:3013 length:1068 start_codon:yes stop_codon:yes gene_type:complete
MIFKLLIVFILSSIPLSIKTETKIPIRQTCDEKKYNQNYKYYEMQEAYDFGRKIQTLLAKKDLKGIYKIVLIDELKNGPRKAYFRSKSFDQIFPKEWVSKITSSKIPCNSLGWRGFQLADGLIWYDLTPSGKWSIQSINGVNQENFEDNNIVGWRTKKGLISPTCFPTFGHFENTKINLYSEKFKIKDKIKFKTSPGKYIGKTIPINYQIEHPTHIRGNNNYVYSLTTNLNDCFKWSLQNGFGKKKSEKYELVAFNNFIYLKNRYEKNKKYDHYKPHYKILKKIDLKTCNKLAKQLTNKCKEAYLISIGYQSGGTIGWLGGYYIFGLIEEKNNEYIVPLKFFNLKNLALNFLEKN